MDLMVPQSPNFDLIEQKMLYLDGLVSGMQEYLNQTRSAAIPASIYEGVAHLGGNLKQLHKSLLALESERRNLYELSQIGQFINSSLELDEVLQIVMDTLIQLLNAERGFLMLCGQDGELRMRVGRNWARESIPENDVAISRTVVNRVFQSGQPILTTNAQEDPRFIGQESVVAHSLLSILCVPMRAKGEVIGVLYADNRLQSGLFTVKELELLSAFANQAAVAIDNARLFASVRNTLAEVIELKNLMDNVFSSIASGVLTVDTQGRVMMCNRAAETMLGRAATELIGNELAKIFPALTPVLMPSLQRVFETDQPVLGLEASQTLPDGRQVNLCLSLSALKDMEKINQGVAIVMEDLTEKLKLEAQRRLFERMVSPAVIDQLETNSLQLGGQRREITVLFADLRGFTSFSETSQPEELVAVLNRYLAAATEAVLREEGTVDKFVGDAVMAWFNAPIPQPDHALRAVRAALAIRAVVEKYHREMQITAPLSFGIGIHLGDAILGLIGSEKRLDYTAIGDSVNTAKRVQENAAPGQVLITETVYRLVKDIIHAQAVPPIRAKGKREPIPVFELLGLKE